MVLDAVTSRLSLDGYGPAVLMVVAALRLLLWPKFRIKMDPREPPLVRPWIPFVGHLVGMLRYHQEYFEKLSVANPVPAFTLPIFTSKMYIIASPELQQAAFRAQNLDFDPFMVEFGVRMVNSGPEVGEKLRHVPEDPKEMPFLKGFHKALHEYMTPGPNVLQMNANMLKTIAREVNGIQDEHKDSLYLWLRNMFTEATANAIFGSNNPWAKDRSLINSFWNFEKNVLFLLAGFIPSVLAPKAFKARLENQDALREYFAAGHNEDADVSRYARARAEIIRKYGFSGDDVGRFEIANIHVSSSNATPTFFWLTLFIASDPKLTDNIRAELSQVTSASSHGDKREMTIDVTNISEKCPLLHSAYQETMRLTDAQVSTRIVKKDFILSDSKNSYLLQKGATLQIPGGISHNSTAIWGPDAATFNPRRFLKAESSSSTVASETDKELEKLRKKAFVPFGGGIHLCPGRHFAFAEILGSVAVMVMGYDLTTKDGAPLPSPKPGEWKTIKFGEAVGKPYGRLATVGARIRRRQGFENIVWKFETGWNQNE